MSQRVLLGTRGRNRAGSFDRGIAPWSLSNPQTCISRLLSRVWARFSPTMVYQNAATRHACILLQEVQVRLIMHTRGFELLAKLFDKDRLASARGGRGGSVLRLATALH